MRLYLLGDVDAPAPGSRLTQVCDRLATDPASPVVRYTPDGSDVDARFDVRAVLQWSHHAVEPGDLPELLRPRVGRLGLVDREKVFCPDLDAGPDVFDLRGVDRSCGAMVVVRPDQHVAQVLPLDAFDAVAAFFDSFLRT